MASTQLGVKAGAYHAGLALTERQRVSTTRALEQELGVLAADHPHAPLTHSPRPSQVHHAFIRDELRLVCATVAFGMGTSPLPLPLSLSCSPAPAQVSTSPTCGTSFTTASPRPSRDTISRPGGRAATACRAAQRSCGTAATASRCPASPRWGTPTATTTRIPASGKRTWPASPAKCRPSPRAARAGGGRCSTTSASTGAPRVRGRGTNARCCYCAPCLHHYYHATTTTNSLTHTSPSPL